MQSVKFVHISKEEMEETRGILEKRYELGSTVPGTKSYHCFYSSVPGTVLYKRTSTDVTAAGSHCFFANNPGYSINELPMQTYVACHYDEQWWIGIIVGADDGDIHIFLLAC